MRWDEIMKLAKFVWPMTGVMGWDEKIVMLATFLWLMIGVMELDMIIVKLAEFVWLMIGVMEWDDSDVSNMWTTNDWSHGIE